MFQRSESSRPRGLKEGSKVPEEMKIKAPEISILNAIEYRLEDASSAPEVQRSAAAFLFFPAAMSAVVGKTSSVRKTKEMFSFRKSLSSWTGLFVRMLMLREKTCMFGFATVEFDVISTAFGYNLTWIPTKALSKSKAIVFDEIQRF